MYFCTSFMPLSISLMESISDNRDILRPREEQLDLIIQMLVKPSWTYDGIYLIHFSWYWRHNPKAYVDTLYKEDLCTFKRLDIDDDCLSNGMSLFPYSCNSDN